MERVLSILGNYPIYPLFFASYPVLYLYAINAWQIGTAIIWQPLIISLVTTLLSWTILTQVLKNVDKSALLITALSILFFSYGSVQKVLLNRKIQIGLNKFLIPMWGCMALVSSFVILQVINNMTLLTRFFNLVSVGIFTALIINIVNAALQKKSAAGKLVVNFTQTEIKLKLPPKPPDIYYIVVDGYMRSDLLETVLGFDNSKFTNFLKRNGFTVVKQSSSNYPYTMFSMASSLNMEYVNFVTAQVGSESRDYSVTHPLIYANRVGQLLKSVGYHFFQVGSWWEGTNKSQIADEVFTWRKVGSSEEFNKLLFKKTILYALCGGDANLAQIEDSRQALFYEFSKIPQLGGRKQPTFVFAHIISPHSPYVFGRQGELIRPPEAGWSTRTTQEAYINQLIFLNSQLSELVKKLLSKSKTPPVIIIQSDHGWAWALGWDLYPHKSLAEKFDVRQVFGIMNAFYLPKISPNRVYETITPVNTFRLIFNTYFGTQLKLLPDKSYLSDYYVSPYKFTDVTRKLNKNTQNDS